MVRTGDVRVFDTVYVQSKHHFQINIENDFVLAGISPGFRVYGNGSVSWNWPTQPDGLPTDGLEAVNIITGCRLGHPDGGALDNTGLIINETNMDGASPDCMQFGGYAVTYGLDVGSLEPMINVHFEPTLGDDYVTGMICIDSAFIPPYGIFSFLDPYGGSGVPPQFDGPFCWPVKKFLRGDFDMDGEITVGDPADLIQYIFGGKPNTGPIEAGDANCDGETNIGDVTFLINYIFNHGPAPGCP